MIDTIELLRHERGRSIVDTLDGVIRLLQERHEEEAQKCWTRYSNIEAHAYAAGALHSAAEGLREIRARALTLFGFDEQGREVDVDESSQEAAA